MAVGDFVTAGWWPRRAVVALASLLRAVYADLVPRFIQDQRRAPRVPLRVGATVEHRGIKWRVETQDVGPGGCLITSERSLLTGVAARIRLDRGPASAELAACGTVVRFLLPDCSISFDRGPGSFHNGPPEWFRNLLASDHRLRTWAAHVPPEVDVDSRIFLMNPPRIVDLSPDEAALIASTEQGISIDELLSRAGLSESRSKGILFSLFQKRVLTLSVAKAGDARKWRDVLAAAGNALPEGTKAPETAPTQGTNPGGHLPPVPAPTHATSTVASSVSPVRTPRYQPSTGAAVTTRLLRGVESMQRPPEAEAVFARARAAATAGRLSEAVPLLRQALTLAPQDREIAALFAQIAFRCSRDAGG